MEGLKYILTFCVVFGMLSLCVILIVSGILRWIAPSVTRSKRLNILAWIGAAVLSAASLLYFTWGSGGNDNTKTLTFLNASGKLFMVLVLGVVAASAVVLLVIIAIYLCNVLRIITHAGNRACVQDKRLEGFILTLRSPAVVSAITLGIMALFIIFPLLVGMSSNETSGLIEDYEKVVLNSEGISEEDENHPLLPTETGNQIENYEDGISNIGHISEDEDQSSTETDGLMEIWGNGVKSIGRIFDGKSNTLSDAFATYTLIYTIMLGIGLAAVKILHSTIARFLGKKTHKDLIEEYLSPIGLLGVSVAALWVVMKSEVSWKNAFEIVGNLFRSFTAVVIIVALGVMVLEIIRLLIDVKELFVRQEVRYLLVALVGECVMMLMNVTLTFFGALCNVIGGKGDAEFAEFDQKVREKMKRLMIDQLDTKKTPPTSEKSVNSNDHERIFEAFDQKTTKK